MMSQEQGTLSVGSVDGKSPPGFPLMEVFTY